MNQQEVFEARDALVSSFTENKALMVRVYERSRIRIRTMMRVTGIAIPREELEDAAYSALATGVYRALLVQFSEENNLTEDWWKAARKRCGFHGSAQYADLNVIAIERPDFLCYMPSCPPTQEAVLQASCSEFRVLLYGHGTTTGDIVDKRRHRGSGSYHVFDFLHIREDETNPTERGHLSWEDPSALAEIEARAFGVPLEDESKVFDSPLVSLALRRAVEEYGEAGVYWFTQRFFFPNRFSALLRGVGTDEAVLGETQFGTVKRDMIRKLPMIDLHMLSVLRREPEIVAMEKEYGPQVGHESPYVSEEYAAYVRRQRAKGAVRMRALFNIDHACLPYVSRLDMLSVVAFERLLNAFLTFERKPLQRARFLRVMRSLFNQYEKTQEEECQ